MDFGRVANLTGIDFSLPPDRPQTLALLARQSGHAEGFYTGCPAWGSKAWVGSLYPPQARPKEFLYHYSRQFDTIELNTTHYRIPMPEQVRRWKDQTPASFRFCPKIPQSVSHTRRLKNAQLLTEEFCDSVSHFEDRLGVCFLQLPPDFSPASSDVLCEYVNRFPRYVPLAIEFRHPEWFTNDAEALLAVLPELEKASVGTVLTDVAGRRDVLHLLLSTPVVLVRFVGNDLHPTDYARAEAWAARLHAWKVAGLKAAYFFIHEPGETNCPQMAEYFTRYARKHFSLGFRQVQLPGGEQERGQKALF